MNGISKILRLYALFIPLLLAAVQITCAREGNHETPITHIITVEHNVDLHIVDWGGHGDPLLFIPSWASTSHIYDEFAPRFTDNHHVLVMNMRGHGPSSRPDYGYTIDRLTKDIEAVLDKLHIQKVNLAGLSRSESLITWFAANYPQRVASLIYLSGPIDRAYSREFFKSANVRQNARQRGALEDMIWDLCNIHNHPHPPGSFDAAADKVGVEWRSNDPAPPYEKITAPAIAFWEPIRAEIDTYRKDCSNAADQAVVSDLLKRYASSVAPLYPRMDHDMNLYKEELVHGKIIEIPGAQYHTYVSHPDLVEKEMRDFFEEDK